MKYSWVAASVAVAGIVLGIAGCSNTNPANQPNTAAAAPDTNPADGNLAPVDQTVASQTGNMQQAPVTNAAQSGTYNPPPAPAQSGSYNPPPPPPANYSSSSQSGTADYAAGSYDSGSYDSGAYDSGYDQNYSGQQVVEATQAPPPLPEYSQPPCPGDNYIWTPGYWSYASAGYYWVPGVWVVAPYVNALWTPPYWDFYSGHYRWHHGYWGDHIGFYGGINYGFGYVGRGFYGGYWRDRHFNYNRDVTNVNVSVVHNVYNYRVTNVVTNTRISYNGGPGGINVRPTPPEIAVLHEQRMAPVAAQIAHARQAESNREQFASVNRGRPAEVALARPLATEYHAPAARPNEVPGHPQVLAPVARPAARGPAPEMRAQVRPEPARPEPARPGQPQPMQAPQAGRPQPGRPEAGRPEAGRPGGGRAEPFRPAPQPAQAAPPRVENRPVPPAARPMPQARPMQAPQPARPEVRPEPQRPQPVPQARPMEAPRPAPAPRAEPPRPQPQPRPMEAPRPQPAARPAPAPHVEAPRPQPAPHVEAPRPQPAPRVEAPRPAPAPHAEAPHPAPPHPAPAPHNEHPEKK